VQILIKCTVYRMSTSVCMTRQRNTLFSINVEKVRGLAKPAATAGLKIWVYSSGSAISVVRVKPDHIARQTSCRSRRVTTTHTKRDKLHVLSTLLVIINPTCVSCTA
jgi:hypothetical protein